MRDIDESKLGGVSYYNSHLAVHKKCSTSTKMRVVFDLSMKSTSGCLLNDILHEEIVFQPEMLWQIICFRLLYTADVTKMYSQILIHSH